MTARTTPATLGHLDPAEEIAAAKAQPSPVGLPVLLALSDGTRHIYAGTVPAAEVQRRRAANKVARRSRRANRRSAR